MVDREPVSKEVKLKELDSSIEGLSSAEASARIEKYGKNAIETKSESRLRALLKTFWGPIPWMIEVAALLSLIIGHWSDFFIIMTLLIVNSFIEFIQKGKAQSALDALKASMALKARAKRDGVWSDVDATTLVPGDIVSIENGDVIPADLIALEGNYVSIDQASLTGESLPVSKKTDDEIYSGSVVKQGAMVCLVSATGENTFFGKTASLVAEAGNVSHFQQTVLNVGKFLIVGAMLLSVVIISKALYMHENALSIIEMVMVLLVASIPAAMPAVLSVTMALGAVALSKKKAIVSRLQAIEELAGVDILCSDKTGTLTKNELTLDEPILYSAKDADEINLLAALASNSQGNDAIDKTILESVQKDALSGYVQAEFFPFDPVSKRTSATIQKDGVSFSVAKGAPKVIIDMCTEDEATKKKALNEVEYLAQNGFRALGVARTKEGSSEYELLGILSLLDPPRDDSKETIDKAREHGIEVKMVTGDDVSIAKQICKKLGIGSNIRSIDEVLESDKYKHHDIDREIVESDGFARVFPEHKYNIVRAFQKKGHYTAMTGDGVNDAPALKQADVGFAVSGATDAARSAADIVLTLPGLSVIIDAVDEARKIYRKIQAYVLYRIAMTINIMFFTTLSIVFLDKVPMSAVMIIMLALLNDLPTMAISYDNAVAEKKPVHTNISNLFVISAVLGFVTVFLDFVLMHLAASYFYHDAKQVQTMIFLFFIITAPLILFVTRANGNPFKSPLPSGIFTVALSSSIILAIILSLGGILVPAIGLHAVLFVIGFSIFALMLLTISKIIIEGLIHYHKNHPIFSELNQRVY
ncbi:MAG: plasma-membrane proton-efflux P-type ATPase [Campylobacterales bacterium]